MHLRGLLSLLVFALACGTGISDRPPADDPGGTTLTKGTTSCGSITCQAGQYCAEASLDLCRNGCVGDQNCEQGKSCQDIDSMFRVGICRVTLATCGNEKCDAGEDSASCPRDCGSTADKQTCKQECDSYDFFSCIPGDLQTCYSRCERASSTQLSQFSTCAQGATVHCDLSCLSYLPPG